MTAIAGANRFAISPARLEPAIRLASAMAVSSSRSSSTRLTISGRLKCSRKREAGSPAAPQLDIRRYQGTVSRSRSFSATLCPKCCQRRRPHTVRSKSRPPQARPSNCRPLSSWQYRDRSDSAVRRFAWCQHKEKQTCSYRYRCSGTAICRSVSCPAFWKARGAFACFETGIGSIRVHISSGL